MLLVSINVSQENISVKFLAFVNLSCCVIFELSKFAYMCLNVTKINRSVGSVLEFQQNDPQNRQKQKIVTLMNNKVAAITKTMELLGDK